MTFQQAKTWARENTNVLFFVGGFLFDSLTMSRIDNVLDLALQTFYLSMITVILVAQVAVQQGRWIPQGWITKFWHYETEAIHFFYGGLLSGYIVFYFKSASASRSAFFLILVAVLMVANEMPQVKKAGARLRIGLHAFCIVSFLNYLIPVLIGFMNHWTFAASVALAALAVGFMVKRLSGWYPQRRSAMWTLGWPPVLVLIVLVTLYVGKWIPPVPLSLKYMGIYHQIARENTDYALSYPKPSWYTFWKKESRPFRARPEDVVNCFVRVFAPRRFTHQISLRWSVQDPRTGRFMISDRVPLAIHGGRGEGFRGFAAKSRHTPGQWRVEAVTEDDRIIGSVDFKIVQDDSTDERTWMTRRM